MLRVDTIMTGPSITGGGINQLFVAGGTQTEADSAQALVSGFWEDIAALAQAPNVFSVQGEVLDVDPSTGNTTGVFSTTPHTHNCINTGEILPPSLQVLVRLRTGVYVNGREVRGRIFLPGMSEAQATSGKPAASLISAVQTAADLLITAGDPDSLLVWSRTHGVAHPVVSASVWSEFAVLRSRRD